ncbi:MAG TPA: tripartite tricarboxylate transporter substrate-binding protein [Xanthobacteraceae bacterium]|jgi:tripartite-type tricarboxylate transporter receptor subunit TctC
MMNAVRAVACLAALVVAGASHAQTYPSGNVRIVVPYPPGGPTDTIARLSAQKFSEAFGHQFYVENVSGASGARGAALVAGAPADGHTLLFVTNDLAVTSTLSTKIQYDPIKSFAPIGLASVSPSVLLVHPSVPARTLQEFVQLARADPAKYSFASMSLGQNLLTSEKLFRFGLNLPLVRVPFTGAAPILASTVAGHTLVAYIGLPSAVPHIREGTLRALAVTSPKRSPIVPDVPTMAESGLDDQETELIIGLVAPAATRRAIVDLLSRQLALIVAMPDVQQRLTALGFTAVGSTPEEFAAQIKADIEKWSKVVRDAGIKVE